MEYRQVKIFLSTFILTVVVICFSNRTIAQFQEIEVGINGLTCSMCSYSVENSIKKLPYISLVKMDLNKNIAQVYSEKGSSINFLEVADRVKKSGFSVRYISFILSEDIKPIADGKFELGGKQFLLLNDTSGTLAKGTSLQLVGEAYLPKSELKKYTSKLSAEQKKKLHSDQIYFVIHEK